MDKTLFPDLGRVRLPETMIKYVEEHGARIEIEQTVSEAVAKYAACTGTKIKIKHFCEYCSICGWNSLTNKKQKRLLAERRHRLERSWETVFEWDNYGNNVKSLAEEFQQYLSSELPY